ncbi:MAG: hypothetical protein ABSE15_08975 [Candidatus Bathyarchaeia archaeon]
MKRDSAYLKHILDAISDIGKFMQGLHSYLTINILTIAENMEKGSSF